MKRIGVDVGGTFTDLILVDEEAGRITVDKVPSTPDDPAKHFIGWLDEVDPDELFDSGRAWGLSIVRRSIA